MLEIEPDNSPTAALRRMIVLLIAALVMACGIAAQADSVRLYDQAGIKTDKVTLADIAELQGPHAKALGGIELATVKGGRQEIEISMDEVESALDEAGANWGLISLRGFGSCRVIRLAPPPDVVIGHGQAVAANIETPIDLDAGLTLRARVEKMIIEFTGMPKSDLRIAFSDRDSVKLDRPILGRSIEIEPTSQNKLGRVPVVIRLYESGRVSQSFSVRAHVQRVLLAVVVSRPIARGQIFTRSDLEVRECTLEDDDVTPITDPTLAIGQEAAAAIRAGDVLLARKVKAPVMVKRGELVIVRCMVGGLVVRTVGRAAQNGSIDDIIEVRTGRSGESFPAVVIGRGEAVISAGSALQGQRLARRWNGEQQGAMK